MSVCLGGAAARKWRSNSGRWRRGLRGSILALSRFASFLSRVCVVLAVAAGVLCCIGGVCVIWRGGVRE